LWPARPRGCRYRRGVTIAAMRGGMADVMHAVAQRDGVISLRTTPPKVSESAPRWWFSGLLRGPRPTALVEPDSPSSAPSGGHLPVSTIGWRRRMPGGDVGHRLEGTSERRSGSVRPFWAACTTRAGVAPPPHPSGVSPPRGSHPSGHHQPGFGAGRRSPGVPHPGRGRDGPRGQDPGVVVMSIAGRRRRIDMACRRSRRRV
jgi:hypothetical protein